MWNAVIALSRIGRGGAFPFYHPAFVGLETTAVGLVAMEDRMRVLCWEIQLWPCQGEPQEMSRSRAGQQEFKRRGLERILMPFGDFWGEEGERTSCFFSLQQNVNLWSWMISVVLYPFILQPCSIYPELGHLCLVPFPVNLSSLSPMGVDATHRALIKSAAVFLC